MSSQRQSVDDDTLTGSPFSSRQPAQESRFVPGDILAERFTIVRFIASGGMGEVYEVQDSHLEGEHVALKTLLQKLEGSGGTGQRLEHEVRLARRVTHPNLCPIYDIFHCKQPAPPFSFLTMRLLPGETLAGRLAQGPIPREEALAIFRQIALGLAALHAGGIIHRDIKPNNVILDGAGRDLHLWITDFGLARIYDPGLTAATQSIAGTHGYMAPELLLGAAPSLASDIYAFGVLAHEVFTGAKPDSQPASEITHRLESSPIPHEFARLIPEFLAHDPTRRTTAFQQLLVLLDPMAAGSIYAREQPTFWTRRRFITAAACGTAALAGGLRWKWDQVSDSLHPLPLKRFVALLNWPAAEPSIKPLLSGVMDAIVGELSRAESFDRNLLVIPGNINGEPTTAKAISDLRETLGANLVLATSVVPQSDRLHLTMRVLDPATGQSLRHKTLTSPIGESTTLPGRAVHAAAQLLNISHLDRRERSADPDTQSPAAYAAFQAAEALRKQDNDTGLNAAIDKYREAIDLDPRYATAHAKLALAYLRLYFLHGDSAALNLARGNADTALLLNPDLIEGHLARSTIFRKTADFDGAEREVGRALALDPDNPRTLVYQGQLLTQLNRWQEAERTFSRIMKIRPNYWLAHNELGVLYNAEGDYPRALTEFRAASLVAPKNALTLNNAGAIYLQQGRIEQAKDALKRSLELNVNDSAETSMAATLRSGGNADAAIPYARKAVELNSAEGANWFELADCYSLAKGHRAEAAQAYSEAARAEEEMLRTNPSDGPGWMWLALCKAKIGEHDQVPALIERAEREAAADMDSQLRKARVLEVIGQREAALQTTKACLKRGATDFQFQTMPDMGPLCHDLRYKSAVQSITSNAVTNTTNT